MKRILVLLISILLSLPLALGGIAGVAYYTTSEENIPKPSIMAMDVPVAPAAYHWREPVFGGLIHRDFEKELPAQGTHLGQLGAATLPLSVPAGYNSRATVYSGQEKMWSGQAAELANYAFLDNGRYSMLVECERPGTDMKGSGTISYLVSFVVQVEPRFESSEEWVAQGDVMAIRVFNLQSQQPKAESTLGNIQFVPSGNGIMTAYVPIGHGCPLGTYSIQLSIGHYIFDIPVRVTESHFGLEAVVVPEEVPGVETPPEQSPTLTPH